MGLASVPGLARGFRIEGSGDMMQNTVTGATGNMAGSVPEARHFACLTAVPHLSTAR